MKKIVSTFLAGVFLVFSASTVFGHVANEKTIYEDIEFSEAKEEILLLRGVNAIGYEHGVNMFHPLEKLTKKDLALWTAAFHKLGAEGDAPETLQRLAVEQKYVDSLEGNAIYEDVKNAFLGKSIVIENPNHELTKEEAALFLSPYLTKKAEGKNLFEKAGLKAGPSGLIEQVTSEMEGEGDATYKVFTITLNGKEYKISSHPKVLNGSVDLSTWKDVELEKTYMSEDENGNQLLEIVIVKKEGSDFSFLDTPAEEAKADKVSEEIKSPVKNDNSKETTEKTAKEDKGFPVVPVVGIGLIALIFLWLFGKKK